MRTILLILLLANINTMKSFKQFLIEAEETQVKTQTTKPAPKMGEGGRGQVKAPVKIEEPEEETAKPEEPKPKVEDKKPETDKEDPFEGNEQMRRIYGAIVSAEHSAEFVANKNRPALTDPFAFSERVYQRTDDKGGKSSAYGPVQIVNTTLQGFFKQRPQLFKGNEAYVQQFMQQGKKFLQAKGTPGKYGPGCVGDLCKPEFHIPYQKMAVSVFKGKAAEKGLDLNKPLTPEQLNKFVTYWRGANQKEDPRYFQAFNAAYNKTNQQQQN